MEHSHTTDAPTTASGSRHDRWRAGWRVSLRMARRDVRRHRGRSLLVVIMVGLPVLLLTAGSTLWFSENLDAAERLPFQIGSSQGFIVGPRPDNPQQLLDPSSGYARSGARVPAKRIPGFAPGREQEALTALLGGRLHEMSVATGVARIDRHYADINILEVSGAGSEHVLAPRASLTSGRWPTKPGEVLVTPTGQGAGLPTSGTFEIQVALTSGQQRTSTEVTVVGTGQGFSTYSAGNLQPVQVIMSPAVPVAGQTAQRVGERQWLVERNRPITWAEVQRLNTFGVAVYSRHVALHPESVQLPPGVTLPAESNSKKLYVVGGATFGLLLLTSLLAGPAFAVGAARQRRTLALAALNGATRAQLRRTVLAQALVLGVGASTAGAVTGVLLGALVSHLVGATQPTHFFGPLQVPWEAVLLVVGAGAASSVLTALLPTRGLGRLNIVAVLKGQGVSAPLRRRVTLLGAALASGGLGFVLLAPLRSPDRYFIVVAGGLLLLVPGSLLLVPPLLGLGSRLGSSLPLAARMAARDTGRLRGRAAPTVAAILGSAAVLTTVCVALDADTAAQAKRYQPTVLSGQAVIERGEFEAAGSEDVGQVVRATDPGLTAVTLRHIVENATGPTVKIAARKTGCTPSDVIPEAAFASEASTGNDRNLLRCATVSAHGLHPGTAIVTADAKDLADFWQLDAAQRRALTDGGIAVLDPSAAATLPGPTPNLDGGRPVEQMRAVDLDTERGLASFYRYTTTPSVDGQNLTVDDQQGRDVVRLPVVRLTHEQWTRTVWATNLPAAFITTDTAKHIGLTTTAGPTLVRGDSPISFELETVLTDAISARLPGATVTVERGFQRGDALIVGVTVGVIGLIILVATLIATALGQVESAPLLGTLAAVGATRRTRRALAAAHATYLGVLGAALGVLVGLPPGIAISRLLTASYTAEGLDTSTVVISIPWVQIMVPVVVVPLLAGALAWVSIRRAPVVVRRTT